jgi:hypothetical protein
MKPRKSGGDSSHSSNILAGHKLCQAFFSVAAVTSVHALARF